MYYTDLHSDCLLPLNTLWFFSGCYTRVEHTVVRRPHGTCRCPEAVPFNSFSSLKHLFKLFVSLINSHSLENTCWCDVHRKRERGRNKMDQKIWIRREDGRYMFICCFMNVSEKKTKNTWDMGAIVRKVLNLLVELLLLENF